MPATCTHGSTLSSDASIWRPLLRSPYTAFVAFGQGGGVGAIAELTTKQLRRGAHRSVAALKRAIREFLEVHNEHPKPLIWTKPADEILASIARLRTALPPRMPADL